MGHQVQREANLKWLQPNKIWDTFQQLAQKQMMLI